MPKLEAMRASALTSASTTVPTTHERLAQRNPRPDNASMGYSLESNDSNRTTYEHVKRVAVIGAGVAGLQLAERLGKKPGLEVSHCRTGALSPHTHLSRLALAAPTAAPARSRRTPT